MGLDWHADCSSIGVRNLISDFVFGARLLRRSPGFTIAALLSLGLGIGVNCTTFTVFDAVLLRPLPVRDADRLVAVTSDPVYQIGRSTGPAFNSYSYPMYLALREPAEPLMGLVCRGKRNMVLSHRGVGEKVRGEFVSTDFFDVIGVGVGAGRLFQADDARAAPVAVLSHGYWRKRFGEDPSAIGAEVAINGSPVIVVGVAEAGFAGVQARRPPAVYLPIESAADLYSARGSSILEQQRTIWLQLFGRLRDSVSREQAQAALAPRFRAILAREVEEMDASTPAERKEQYRRQALALEPGNRGVDRWHDAARPGLVLLMAVAGVVLLIACANVANLLLARAMTRQREAAVRQTLGADPMRLLRQFLVESLQLALLGGALGVVIGQWGLAMFAELLPPGTTIPEGVDGRALLFAIAVSTGTALLFGIVPGLRLSRGEATAALKTGEVTETSKRAGMRRLLVAAQVGLSVVLLTTAGLFLRTLMNLYAVDPGFPAEKLVVFSLDPPRSGYDKEKSFAFRQELIERVRALPGVEAVATADEALLSGNEGISVIQNVEGHDSEIVGAPNGTEFIGPGFLSAVGVPLLAGRECSSRDTKDTPKVAVVNHAFARHYFGGANPVGKRFSFGEKGTPLTHEIVGFVPDAAFRSPREIEDRMVFTCADQYQQEAFTVHVRTTGDPAALFAAIRQEVRRLDAEMPILALKTVEMWMSETLAGERVLAILTTVFAGLALLLAGTGLYGVISYSVARRTRELGIRIAVGATRQAILGAVLRESFLVAAAGIVCGVAVSLAVARLTRGLLFGVGPQDPATLILASVTGLALALVASWAPARRALAVDPVRALRHE